MISQEGLNRICAELGIDVTLPRSDEYPLEQYMLDRIASIKGEHEEARETIEQLKKDYANDVAMRQHVLGLISDDLAALSRFAKNSSANTKI